MLKSAPSVSQVLSLPCHLNWDVNKLPQSNLSVSGCGVFAGQQNMCLLRLRDVRTRLTHPSQTDWKKLTYWSQIVSSAGEIQYPRDISGNHPFHHVHGILKRP